MPLKKGKKNIKSNIRELIADNKKKGKAKGANGRTRSREQIIAIALSKAKKSKKGSKSVKKHIGMRDAVNRWNRANRAA